MKRLPAVLLLIATAYADTARDAALDRAHASVRAAIPKAEADPSRPAYHFRPPAQWMNDPNGPLYHNGYYHVFYQHNPYGDVWGHMHWGHARSRDLVTWEHLPIALWPSEDKGEAHVFSGCGRINGDGVPMLFYTSVAPDPKKRPNQQWAAIGSPDLITWEKHPDNPILDLSTHGGPIFGDSWRDPFIFDAGNRTFMVLGADTADEAVIPLYESTSPTLDKWVYKGILYRKPKTEVPFFECPNFFPLGDKWMLIYSPYRPLEYVVGSFNLDSLQFTPENHGVLDIGSFYASNIVFDPSRCVLLGWVRGFKEGLGWNGCMSLPRILTLGPDLLPRQTPLPALESLRAAPAQPVRSSVSFADISVGPMSEVTQSFSMKHGGSARIELTPLGDGSPIAITFGIDGVRVGDLYTAWPGGFVPEAVSYRLYLDNTVLELYVNDGVIAITRVIDYAPRGYRAYVTAESPAELGGIEVYPMKSVWSTAP